MKRCEDTFELCGMNVAQQKEKNKDGKAKRKRKRKKKEKKRKAVIFLGKIGKIYAVFLVTKKRSKEILSHWH